MVPSTGKPPEDFGSRFSSQANRQRISHVGHQIFHLDHFNNMPRELFVDNMGTFADWRAHRNAAKRHLAIHPSIL